LIVRLINCPVSGNCVLQGKIDIDTSVPSVTACTTRSFLITAVQPRTDAGRSSNPNGLCHPCFMNNYMVVSPMCSAACNLFSMRITGRRLPHVHGFGPAKTVAGGIRQLDKSRHGPRAEVPRWNRETGGSLSR